MSSHFYDRDLEAMASVDARKCVGETPESRTEGLRFLRMKLLGLDDLTSRLDDSFLLRFLRVCKFDCGRAFERIRKYYAERRKYSHIFDRFYPSAAHTALRAGHLRASPRRAQDNSALVIYKRGLFTPSTIEFDHMFRLDALIFEYLVDNPLTQLCGITIILDFQGYGFQTFLQDTPGRVKMSRDIFQNSFPLRFRSIHVVNCPDIFSLVYNLCYPFLSKKIRSRMHFHWDKDDWKSLHAHVPGDILPGSYGGVLPDSDMIDLSQQVVKREDYFKEELQFGFLEKKRGFFI